MLEAMMCLAPLTRKVAWRANQIVANVLSRTMACWAAANGGRCAPDGTEEQGIGFIPPPATCARVENISKAELAFGL